MDRRAKGRLLDALGGSSGRCLCVRPWSMADDDPAPASVALEPASLAPTSIPTLTPASPALAQVAVNSPFMSGGQSREEGRPGGARGGDATRLHESTGADGSVLVREVRA